jgi:hypothetical protein
MFYLFLSRAILFVFYYGFGGSFCPEGELFDTRSPELLSVTAGAQLGASNARRF